MESLYRISIKGPLFYAKPILYTVRGGQGPISRSDFKDWVTGLTEEAKRKIVYDSLPLEDIQSMDYDIDTIEFVLEENGVILARQLSVVILHAP